MANRKGRRIIPSCFFNKLLYSYYSYFYSGCFSWLFSLGPAPQWLSNCFWESFSLILCAVGCAACAVNAIVLTAGTELYVCGAAGIPGSATLSSRKLLLPDTKMENLGFEGLG